MNGKNRLKSSIFNILDALQYFAFVSEKWPVSIIGIGIH
jgi:hypothetical protein